VDVAAWLRSLGLERYEQTFRDNEIDWEVLPELNEADLERLGLPLGPRKKLLKAIAGLQERAGPEAGPAVAAPLTAPEAERRQLTVMFCDLVGSTALAERLDAEEMGDLIRAYHERVSAEVGRFEGHVAKYMGDGVLAYFGWPRAHEDDAERAIRAGLGIVEGVHGLRPRPDLQPLQVRVGIATGPVVVGELIGAGEARERSVVGETPHLAARLQALAEPDTVVISRRTRRLIGGLFELADLGTHELKGFGRPVRAWRVLGEGRAESRFEALRAATLTPLVGRDGELALLLRRWEQARDGEGQAVLLSGEPGIGKSRLTRALQQELAEGTYTRILHFCSPYHQNSALYPIVYHLQRAARFERDDGDEEKLDKLKGLLARSTDDLGTDMPLLAALLAIPTGTRYPPLDLAPEQQKARTLERLVAQVEGLARREPVLALYEDVHWIDPTSLELLDLLVERVRALPVLVVVTFRPEFRPPWIGQPHVTLLTLNRLSRRYGTAIIDRLTGGKVLPPEVQKQIVAKTDGVPLFLEELTKTILESGLLREEGDRYSLHGPLPPLAIPATLHDSLTARLDRLVPVKEVAQIGAAIGREFSYELLAAVALLLENELHEALARLEEAELVFRRGTPPHATFTFKHALVQDAAYDSMLRSRRQQVHAAIARALEERSAAGATALPEVIAYHCTEAGLAEPAVGYWWRAAQLAAQRSATLEAIAHLENGLTLLRTLPDSPENVRLQLDMQVALGTALMAAKGWSSPATVAAFTRAAELCERVDDTVQRGVVDYGQYLVHLLRGQLDAALATTKAMLRRAERDRNPTSVMIAHRCIGTTLVHRGDFGTARGHLEAALALYEPKEHARLAYRFAYEPRIAMLCYLAHALLHLGHPDQASKRYGQLMEAIRAHRHSPSVAFGLFQASLFWTYERDLGACSRERDFGGGEAIVDELIAICTEHGFSLWRTAGVILKGWLLTRSGEADRGLAQMREGMAAWAGNEAKLVRPRWLLLLASALGRLGQARAGLDGIEEGLALVIETKERWNAAELHLRKGELLLASSAADKAEASFREALAVARDQSAKLWELRAAICLARLRRDRAKREEARELLAPVYGWFSEGFDTPDMIDAKALLEELS
jgi:class 3 adenylate cyclase/predicted ATPase